MAKPYPDKTERKGGGWIGMLMLTVAVVVCVAVIAFLFSRQATDELQVDLSLPEAGSLPDPSRMPNPQPLPSPLPRPG